MSFYVYLVFVRFTISWIRLYAGAGLVAARTRPALRRRPADD